MTDVEKEEKLHKLEKKLKTTKIKANIYEIIGGLTIISPYIIIPGLIIATPFIGKKKKYPYTIEVQYDSMGYESERILDKKEKPGESRLTIYNTYSESDDSFTKNYEREYEIYDISGLSINLAKEIINSDEPARYLNMFGNPIESGSEYQYEISSEDNIKYTKLVLYAQSQEDFYEKFSPLTRIIQAISMTMLVGCLSRVRDMSDALNDMIDEYIYEEKCNKISQEIEKIKQLKR